MRTAGVTATDIALEIGPGLGSLTLALMEEAASVVAVEIDARLANQLPITAQAHSDRAQLLTVINQDALQLKTLPVEPTVLVANLPYNISVPVFLHLLEVLPTLRSGVVMVQAEVADRLAAKPNTKEYGIPSVKAAWWAEVTGAGSVSRSIFWPAPNVDSKLVGFKRRATPGDERLRKEVFTIIDLAFAQQFVLKSAYNEHKERISLLALVWSKCLAASPFLRFIFSWVRNLILASNSRGLYRHDTFISFSWL